MRSLELALVVNVELEVMFEPALTTGDVVSQIRLNVDEEELPTLSVTRSLITYVPSVFAEIVVFADVDEPKVIVPGPETFDHRYDAIPEVTSLAVAVVVNVEFAVLFAPAFTVGGTVSTVNVLVAAFALDVVLL